MKVPGFPEYPAELDRRTVGEVAEFLVELYVSPLDAEAAERGAERARRAAERLTRQGTPVRYLRGLFVPEDETCFLLYEALSPETVRKAARLAGLPCEHVVEAVRTGSVPLA